ncbi:hypothetical protein NW768_009792 [Fusarium equiseti]|uniref:Uncharacterized protein n=1 Tax=Fusarium equiseti TaxID=61235 RepID=A0ABQ8R2I6_FUSEQ|nr:hypothetical protein NW768_009792 [Fusarium equiseti]
MSLLTGQMEGIKLAVQAVEDAGASNQSLMTSMAQTVQAISQCGNVCSAATAVAEAADGTATYKLVQAFDDVRLMMGSTNTEDIAGGSTRVFESVIGRNRARVWIGDLDSKTALAFMNS